ERSDGDEARPAPPLIDRLTDSAASSRIADRLRSGAAVAVLPPAPLIAADPQMAVPESDIRSEGGPTAAARATSRGDVLRSEYALDARERAPREAPAPGVRGDRPAPAVPSRAPSEASAGSANPEPRLPAKSPAPAAVTALPPRAAPAPTRVAATPVRRPTDETLLLRAEQGDVSGVRLLLSEGATPDARDASGFTPLMLAIIHD